MCQNMSKWCIWVFPLTGQLLQCSAMTWSCFGTCLVLFFWRNSHLLAEVGKKHHDRSAKDVNGNNTSLYFDAVTVLNVLYNTWLTASDIIGLLFILIQWLDTESAWRLQKLEEAQKVVVLQPWSTWHGSSFGRSTIRKAKPDGGFNPAGKLIADLRSVKWDHPGRTEKVQTINQMPNTW